MTDLENILKKNGVKPTAMRLLVLKLIINKKLAFSLSDLENNFEKSDRTTLFRTLKTFVKSGIAHKIDDGTGAPKFALCEENCQCDIGTDLHLHFHCNVCNETTCITEQKIPNIILPIGYVAEDVNLVVKGVCDKCSNT